ncbi:LacI family DNA-binding transcriptional regulator [Acuticoccus sp. MNP-M23]|uniref:LacI family DNA-binding transcriptional regulator n=1 Tax=Acuticoccus sp. MNP-M23 TaxID=3072793 RepID=UPI002815EF37|nr:LacI family DNA-binding transcriptional regulator [Acuticoccus sp. MNP-M23]WMS42929.1 LacI family DNA-binding transcriptional regulator [Acuticoccus sp. MNP-M23]
MQQKTRSGSRAVTISDVADLAKVSTATVSRALTEPSRVSVATRERVMAAVAQTGYTPNVAARSLRVARSMMVLVVVPYRITPFFSVLLQSIDRALAAGGYGMLVGDLNDREEQEPRLVRLAAAGQVDGMILLNGGILQSGSLRIDEMGVPLVALCIPAAESIPAVLVNDREGSAGIARHLLELGHRRFGYVGGPPHNHNDIERYQGFVAPLLAAGIKLDEIVRYEGDFHIASGAAVGRNFVAQENRPTAIFCASDMMALGFMNQIQSAGISVPGDVSVAGFDGIDIADYWVPALTTVAQPCEAMGKAAAARLLHLLGTQDPAGSPTPAPPLRQELTVTLRISASTGPAPRSA